jgi:hypothetical protein
MTTPTEKQKAVWMILETIIDSVREAGSLGAPGGVLYAALMAHGCTLEQFEAIMAALVRTGRLRKSGQLYYADNSEATI